MIRRATRFALFVLLTGLALAAGSAHASSGSPELFNTVERLLLWLETEHGFVPIDAVSRFDDTYYYRCYTNGLCVGAGLDGNLYYYDGTVIRLIGPLVDYDQLAPAIPVRLIGSLQGTLADDLAFYLQPVTDSVDATLPVIVGEGQWTAADQEVLLDAFRAGAPVVVLNATAEEAAQLRALLQLSGGADIPAGVTLEAYALDTDRHGDYYEVTILPPGTLPRAEVVTTSIDPAGAPVTSTHEEDAAVDDDAELQALRVRALVEWLRQDAGRDVMAVLTASARDRDTKPGDFKSLEESVRSIESRMVFGFRKNVHALTTNVWSVHNAELNEDWFYVRQKGTFSAANELLPLALSNNINSGEGNDRGRFTDLYAINTVVEGLLGNPAVFLDQASPTTTTGKETVSSSVSWNLSGKLSGSAKCDTSGKCEGGGSAEIGAGVSVSKSVSYDIPDVTVRSQSGTQLNNAGWEFAIGWPFWKDGFGCIGFQGLGPLKTVSGSTFQPVTQWIWRVGPEARAANPAGLPLRVEFKTRVRHIYYGPGCNWNMTNWSQESGLLADRMVVPWPPKP